MQKLTEEQIKEQAFIAERDKKFNERFNNAIKKKFEFNHQAKDIKPAKSNITGWSQLQRHKESLLKFGSALLNTNEQVSFPGSNEPEIGTSPKNSKGEYLSDGNYSLQNGTNFQISNGIVSNVLGTKAQKKEAEIKLAKAQAEVIRLRSESVDPRYNAFQEIYGELFTLTPSQFEKLDDKAIDGLHNKLVPFLLTKMSKAKVAKATTTKLSFLEQCLKDRGWK